MAFKKINYNGTLSDIVDAEARDAISEIQDTIGVINTVLESVI